MSSGVKLTPEAVAAYNELQKIKSKSKYVIMGFSDNCKKVELKAVGDQDKTFADMLELIPDHEARYIFYDCNYQRKDGQQRNKILCVSWSSDDCCVGKHKMLLSTTKPEIKAKCKDYAKEATINERSDLNEENFIVIVSDNRTK